MGNSVSWHTRYKKNGKIYEYSIQGDASDLGTFRIGDELASRITYAGTEVRVRDIAKNPASLLGDRAHQELTEQFALYLRQYPAIQIYYQDKKINPADIEKSVTDYPMEFFRRADNRLITATLTIIEWNTDTDRNLYLCDAFGFALEETKAGIQAPGFNLPPTSNPISLVSANENNNLLPEIGQK